MLLGLMAAAAETPVLQAASQRNELQRVNVVRGTDEIPGRDQRSRRGDAEAKHGGFAGASDRGFAGAPSWCQGRAASA